MTQGYTLMRQDGLLLGEDMLSVTTNIEEARLFRAPQYAREFLHGFKVEPGETWDVYRVVTKGVVVPQ